MDKMEERAREFLKKRGLYSTALREGYGPEPDRPFGEFEVDALAAAFRKVAEEERERCAKVADSFYGKSWRETSSRVRCKAIAAALRSRAEGEGV